jgi:hypothetical protein
LHKNVNISSYNLGHITLDNPSTWKEIQERKKSDSKNIKTYQLIQPCDEEEKPHAHGGKK